MHNFAIEKYMKMKILVTNDDGYYAKGIHVLAKIMKQFGEVTVVAPKYHQSGMSMAVSMGFKQIATKDLGYDEDGIRWHYLDGTPASCIKYGIDMVMKNEKPDVIVSGINHGSNAATAVLYSGTIGAAQEGTVNGYLSIGVSLDTFNQNADFSAVEKLFPAIFKHLLKNRTTRKNILYNINFPYLKSEEIKGIKVGHQGNVYWRDEFQPFDGGVYDSHGVTKEQMGILFTPPVEPGEKTYMMAGILTDDTGNNENSDHILLREGYITIVAHTIDTTDYNEIKRLRSTGLESLLLDEQ